MEFRSGFVSIIGRPNVGKSTLMNKLLQEKISIVSPKPQTTRHQIKGIYNDEDKQIVFLDTPGFLKPRYELQHKMLEYIKHAIKDSDLLLFITDISTFPTNYDKELLSFIQSIKVPKIVLLNKIDLVEQEKTKQEMQSAHFQDFDEIIPISALHLVNTVDFMNTISRFIPMNPPYYDTNDISDLPMRFFVQETVREQIFLNYEQEVPYSTTVVVEQYNEMENKIEIAANIWIERKSQKPIIIGKNGEKIKQIRLRSEKEIYRFAGKRIKLDLWVKIKPNWRNKKNSLKEFGYL